MSTYKMILFDKVHKQTKLIYAVRSQDSGYLGGRWGGRWWREGGMSRLGVTGNAALWSGRRLHRFIQFVEASQAA